MQRSLLGTYSYNYFWWQQGLNIYDPLSHLRYKIGVEMLSDSELSIIKVSLLNTRNQVIPTITNDREQNGVAVQISRADGTGAGVMGAIDIANLWPWYNQDLPRSLLDLLLLLALPNSLTFHRVWIFNVVIIISAPTCRRDMNERSSNSVNLKEKSHLMKLELQCNLKSRKFLWKQRLPIMPKAKMPCHRTKVHFHNNSSDDVLW